MRAERQDMGYVLVRSHDNEAAGTAVDPPHVEYVIAGLEVWTEHLLVVMKPVAAFPGHEK